VALVLIGAPQAAAQRGIRLQPHGGVRLQPDPVESVDAPAPTSTLTFDAAAKGAAALPRLHSLLVSWRGSLVLERYYNGARATRPANIKSASKTFLSAVIGVAIDRGLIQTVKQPIGAFFGDVLGAQQDAPKRQITIEDLLTMRAGLQSTSNRNYGQWVRSSNWVRFVLSRPLMTEPGTDMEYSTGNSHLLSAIITKVTRKSTWQFAQEALAGPIGIELPRWPQDPQGVYFGGNDMLMTPRDMVTFGELYLNHGVAQGRQIVPAAWVDVSFVPRTQSRISGQSYGYGWWMRELAGHQAYFAWGYGGQFIFVVPDLDLVIVTTSATSVSDERRDHRSSVYDLVEHLVIEPIAAAQKPPAVSAGAR
jgi:CubicO group peptidase (beta-lactamase class C family)